MCVCVCVCVCVNALPSQVFPMKPVVHVHVKDVLLPEHEPECLQGKDEHASENVT